MPIQTRMEGTFLVATLLEKRLDAALASPFKDKMNELIENGHHIIILDLSQVDFIDSSGLGMIVSILKRLGGQGDLILCGAHDAVMALFQLTRMDKVFKIYSTVAEVEEKYSSTPS